jgi:hypothetical protein
MALAILTCCRRPQWRQRIGYLKPISANRSVICSLARRTSLDPQLLQCTVIIPLCPIMQSGQEVSPPIDVRFALKPDGQTSPESRCNDRSRWLPTPWIRYRHPLETICAIIRWLAGQMRIYKHAWMRCKMLMESGYADLQHPALHTDRAGMRQAIFCSSS